jgi:hypothetical protein
VPVEPHARDEDTERQILDDAVVGAQHDVPGERGQKVREWDQRGDDRPNEDGIHPGDESCHS